MGDGALAECVQSKRARAVLGHLTTATATANVVVEQAWAAMDEEYDGVDVRHSQPPSHLPMRACPRARPCSPGERTQFVDWLRACFKKT